MSYSGLLRLQSEGTLKVTNAFNECQPWASPGVALAKRLPALVSAQRPRSRAALFSWTTDVSSATRRSDSSDIRADRLASRIVANRNSWLHRIRRASEIRPLTTSREAICRTVQSLKRYRQPRRANDSVECETAERSSPERAGRNRPDCRPKLNRHRFRQRIEAVAAGAEREHRFDQKSIIARTGAEVDLSARINARERNSGRRSRSE